jgi:hypothetical protein
MMQILPQWYENEEGERADGEDSIDFGYTKPVDGPSDNPDMNHPQGLIARMQTRLAEARSENDGWRFDGRCGWYPDDA